MILTERLKSGCASARPNADSNHAFGEADVLDPELHQLGRAGTGLQQSLYHQPSSAVLGVGLVEKAQLLLDRQPVHAAAAFGRGTQTGPRFSGASPCWRNHRGHPMRCKASVRSEP